MNKNVMQRLQILEILYAHMEKSPKAPWVNIRGLETLGQIDFALEVLKEQQHVKQQGFNYRILAKGILTYEDGSQTD